MDLLVCGACDPELLAQERLDRILTITLGRIVWERQPHLTNDVPNDPYLRMTDWINRERISLTVPENA